MLVGLAMSQLPRVSRKLKVGPGRAWRRAGPEERAAFLQEVAP
jgi:hypothetical protein